MTPHYADDWLTVYHGDARAVMAQMEPESVHCVVTSPPYWGLRDYGAPGQLGLEPTPEQYVESMVAVFREVRRVLRSDGTVWLNLGDSYASGGGADYQRLDELGERLGTGGGKKHSSRPSGRAPSAGLAQKQLVGIPWRVAFALQADGWYLRSDIIWSKPNPMPESVTDRPTKSHEYLFLLSKSPRYYWDADAVREEASDVSLARIAQPNFANQTGGPKDYANGTNPNRSMRQTLENFAANPGRNLRSVWSIATAPYPGAHFATFPPKLVEPCIKAGTSERGVCPECGAPWVREVERGISDYAELRGDRDWRDLQAAQDHRGANQAGRTGKNTLTANGTVPSLRAASSTTTGWRPSCDHVDEYQEANGEWSAPLLKRPVSATVLDPFAGSGTTGMVAQSLSRRAVLIDLSMDYLDQLMARNRDIPLGLDVA